MRWGRESSGGQVLRDPVVRNLDFIWRDGKPLNGFKQE